MTAKVDIVVTSYNYGHFLEAAVQSALAQTGVDLRVLVIDDASSDETATIARRLVSQDCRVSLIIMKENVGMIPAFNIGIRETFGDYLVKLDADDLLPSGSLARSIALLEQYPNVGFVYGRPRHFTTCIPRPRLGLTRWKVWPGINWLEKRYERAQNCISQPEAVIRRSTLQLVGEYNTSLPHTSDLEMWLRLAGVADVGRINGVDQGYYRVHANSMQRTVNSGPLKDIVGRRAAFLSFLATPSARLLNSNKLEATVRRKLAAEAIDYVSWTYDRDRVDCALEIRLIEFALETYPSSTEIPEWQHLQERRQRGQRSRWTPRSLVNAATRRVRKEVGFFQWKRTGI